MAAGYDGSIRIDSRIDTKGFNQGISKIRGSLSKVGAALLKIGTAAVIGFAGVLAAVGIIIKGVISLVRLMGNLSSEFKGYAREVDDLKLIFANLKLAVGDAFRPLLTFALPWIQKVVSWVSNLLSMVAQVLAGLTEQSGYWKSNAGSAADTAESSGKIAKNLKKSGDAAEGALAAFDQLNVLDMAEDENGGGSGGGSSANAEWVSMSEKAMGIIEKIKTFFSGVAAFFAPLAEPLGRIWDAIGRIWEAVKKAVGSILSDLVPVFIWFRDNALMPILNLMAKIFEKIATWAEENPRQMKAIVGIIALIGVLLLGLLSPAAQVIGIVLAVIAVVGLLIKYWPEIMKAAKIAIDAVVVFFSNLWLSIRSGAAGMLNAVTGFFSSLWVSIRGVWSVVAAWFQTSVINPLVRAWSTATGAIKGFFTKTFETVKLTIKGVINEIIGFVNTLITGIVNGINNVITLANNIPGISIDMITAPQIPKLASGAVIPPNAAFLAMLGDQRHGNNIEAPEDLIRQIVREETGGMAGQEVTINFAGSLGALVRELKPYIDKENARIGRSLVKGVTA